MTRLEASRAASGVLVLAVSLCVAHPLAGDEVRASPRPGGSVVYTDIDARGRILEVHYGRGSARELASFEVSAQEPPLLVQGWILEDGKHAVLLLLEPTKDRGWHGRLHLHAKGTTGLRATSLRLDLTSGEFAFLALSEEISFVEYRDTRSGRITRLALDVSRNQVLGAFEFPLADDSLHSWPGEGRHLYLARPLEPWLRKVDLETREEVEVTDLSSVLPQETQRTLTFVGALGDHHALVGRKYLQTDQVQLFLVDLERLEVTASSNLMPFFTGRFHLEESEDSVRFTCTVERVVQGHYRATGKIEQFENSGRRIRRLGEIDFEPESQIALRDRSGSFQVFDRVRFDYVSLLEVERTVLRQLPGAYSASAVPLASDLFAKAAEESTGIVEPELPLRRLRIEE